MITWLKRWLWPPERIDQVLAAADEVLHQSEVDIREARRAIRLMRIRVQVIGGGRGHIPSNHGPGGNVGNHGHGINLPRRPPAGPGDQLLAVHTTQPAGRRHQVRGVRQHETRG